MSVWESCENCSKHFQAWECGSYCFSYTSLIPRSHPLTRRNGLVNQIKFLELVHTLTTVSPSNIYAKPTQKRYGYSIKIVREVLCNNHLSPNLIGLLGIISPGGTDKKRKGEEGEEGGRKQRKKEKERISASRLPSYEYLFILSLAFSLPPPQPPVP